MMGSTFIPSLFFSTFHSLFSFISSIFLCKFSTEPPMMASTFILIFLLLFNFLFFPLISSIFCCNHWRTEPPMMMASTFFPSFFLNQHFTPFSPSFLSSHFLNVPDRTRWHPPSTQLVAHSFSSPSSFPRFSCCTLTFSRNQQPPSHRLLS